MTQNHKMKLVCVDGNLSIATLDGVPVVGLIDLQVKQVFQQPTEVTVTLQMYNDDGSLHLKGKAFSADKLANKDK